MYIIPEEETLNKELFVRLGLIDIFSAVKHNDSYMFTSKYYNLEPKAKYFVSEKYILKCACGILVPKPPHRDKCKRFKKRVIEKIIALAKVGLENE